MKKNYNVQTTTRTAMPRSKRMREAGISVSASPSVGPSSGREEGMGGGSAFDGHTHENKKALDAISIDNLFYLWLRQKLEGDSESQLQKVKAGYADHAGDAEFADEAGNAVLWDEHEFADWLNQPVTSYSNVEFKKVLSAEFASPGFLSGALGSGFKMQKKEDGSSSLEIDEITVRKGLHVFELVIQQLKHQGGIVLYTAAGMEITSVAEVPDGFKCYFDNKNGRVPNDFVVGDQARCQRFNADQMILKSYWRLVTEVGENYIVLSSNDCDTNSGLPEIGDVVVQLGNRTDVSRQAAQVISCVGEDAPSWTMYSGISSFDLTGRNIVGVKYDRTKGKPQMYCHGPFYFGDRDSRIGDYITFQEDSNGKMKLVIKADVQIGAGSGPISNLSGFDEMIDAVLDMSEKIMLRTKWENIHGAANTDTLTDNNHGTYWLVKHSFDKYVSPSVDSILTHNGVLFTYGHNAILYKTRGFSALDKAYNDLKDYLTSMNLYGDDNTTGYEREEMARLFTAYYEAERNVSDNIVSDSKSRIDDLSYLSNALKADDDNVTDIEGGVVLSKIIGVRNGGQMVAGINATDVARDDVSGMLMMFAGADTDSTKPLDQRLSDSLYRVYSNGLVVAKNIQANGGNIGNFTINGGWLTAEGDGYSMGFSSARFFLDCTNHRVLCFDINGHVIECLLSTSSRDSLYPSSMESPYEHHVKRIVSTLSSVSAAEPLYSNTALYVEASGASHVKYEDFGLRGGSYAIKAGKGMFGGLRPCVRIIGPISGIAERTLSDLDNTVVCKNSSDITLTFPSDPQPGQIYRIIKCGTGIVNISSSKTIMEYNSLRTDINGPGNVNGFNTLENCIKDFVYDGEVWHCTTISTGNTIYNNISD